MTLQEIVAKFNTTPFLFAGSGITRRYYGLPNWEDLLKEFAGRISDDRFVYRSYVSAAEAEERTQGLLPKVATLIQRDFDSAWYRKPEIRKASERGLQLIEKGASPFKVEIAEFLANRSKIIPAYQAEIGKLKNLAKKNLAGVITTNYDCFFERLFDDYKTYVGQDELVFSPIQGIAEIYKIHGSLTRPESIVINENDYEIFVNKGKYLAAKLMTIFMEYPIIFIGYSLSDTNIQLILNDIIQCLPDDKVQKLQERFVFVDYKPGIAGAEVSTHTLSLDGKMLAMTKVTLSDFGVLFDVLASKKAGIPIKLLRRFKEDISTYILTTKPGPTLQVAALDDKHIDEEHLAISIGVMSTGEYGLRSLIDDTRWYRHIVMDDILEFGYSYDQLLQFAYPDLKKGTNGFLPVWKYLHHCENDYPEIKDSAIQTFNEATTNTDRKNRKTLQYHSVAELWAAESGDPKRASRLMCSIPEEEINLDELESVLRQIFIEDHDALDHMVYEQKNNFKRLIRIYDFLKWGKK